MSKTAFLQAVDNTKLIPEGDKVQVIQLVEGLPDEYIAMYTQMLVEYDSMDISRRVSLLGELKKILEEYVTEVNASTVLSAESKKKMIDLGKLIMNGLFESIKEAQG